MARTLADIRADRAAVLDKLTALDREERAAIVVRDRTIIAAFKSGDRVKDIATRLGLTVNTVYGVLDRKDIHLRKHATPITHLPADQQRAYAKLLASGIGPRAARQIITAEYVAATGAAAAIPHTLAAALRRPVQSPAAPAVSSFVGTHTLTLTRHAGVNSPQG